MIQISMILTLLIGLLFIISFWLKLVKMQNEKKSGFECGFDPNHETRNSFSMRFFLLTIIFLLFDLEITFILSLPLNMVNHNTLTLNMTHLTIFSLFLWSSYLEWKMGALNWFWFDI